jgi:uncharacterized YigZ family protein
LIRYTTVKKEATAEEVILRSRFIGHIAPISSREEAEAYIRKVRDLHRTATHHVPAYIIGEQMELQWTSDDGEPQGTSGPPILQMLVREGLTNLVCVVTRYYGGTKLGTGGLVRAYTETARQALIAAGTHSVRNMIILKVRLPYTLLGKLKNLEQDQPFSIENSTYAQEVDVTLRYECEYHEQMTGMLADLNSGMPLILEQTEKLM